MSSNVNQLTQIHCNWHWRRGFENYFVIGVFVSRRASRFHISPTAGFKRMSQSPWVDHGKYDWSDTCMSNIYYLSKICFSCVPNNSVQSFRIEQWNLPEAHLSLSPSSLPNVQWRPDTALLGPACHGRGGQLWLCRGMQSLSRLTPGFNPPFKFEAKISFSLI